MTQDTLLALKRKATELRISVLDGVHAAGSGHPGGSLSIADLFAYLYFSEMNIDPKDPDAPNRDRLVLSKGHAAPILYAALAHRGYFPVEDIITLRKPGSYLQGHPDKKHIPGVDMSSGSLGQGFSAACGMALAGKYDHKDYRVYAVIGDGESEEGQVWEAAMFAAAKHLDNLTVFVDWNNLQIDGTVEQVNSPLPFDEKFRAFGWNVTVIDGHDLEAIERAVSLAKATKDKPTAVIMKTVKGKGVSFMENQISWHGSAPNDEQYATAIAELKAQLASL